MVTQKYNVASRLIIKTLSRGKSRGTLQVSEKVRLA